MSDKSNTGNGCENQQDDETYPRDEGLPSEEMLKKIAEKIPQDQDMSDWDSMETLFSDVLESLLDAMSDDDLIVLYKKLIERANVLENVTEEDTLKSLEVQFALLKRKYKNYKGKIELCVRVGPEIVDW